MPSATRRRFNEAVTRFWSVAAPLYDTAVVQQWVYRPAQDEMIALLRAHGSRRVADVGCGTGILADRIAREVHPDQIFGVDLSEGMLAQAAQRSTTVQWLTAPAEQLPFDDGSLDAVVSTSAFHWFNQPAALREFHRVLAPGGFAAVATLSPRQRFPLQMLPAPLYEAPDPARMRTLFTDAGFSVDDQHRVRRPLWTQVLSDLITVGVKA
ncbi:methylase involved in ubiquinone/menaquinone biosynthesis [Mycolicibacterium chubuense NBB4]|uniref:Methylase involved in ubiquinone/menaquinone biosynthesis n=1 Tax=Mycolicibacterium chubuense (strain NBB4) TaxID=710421 RepID=I4BJM3_MYCCN|nr:class I SAM-dependent methyltransferase [Mycolicibacterium chubuense]AFM17480.1 methylase involved in ubiquinone/menaquinone biosynthesis [Mycolicibacterium chubuense NBB4]